METRDVPVGFSLGSASLFLQILLGKGRLHILFVLVMINVWGAIFTAL